MEGITGKGAAVTEGIEITEEGIIEIGITTEISITKLDVMR